MAYLIDKDALVAEIEKRIKEVSQIEKASYEIGLFDAYKIILSFLNTLEVKEVDLTWKDVSKIVSIDQQVCWTMGILDYTHNHQQAMEEVLKQFKAQKGEKV